MFLEEPTFPMCPSFGYVANPRYSNTITGTVGGREHINRNWAKPLLAINCTIGPKPESYMEDLTEFWHAVGGSECGFRFKDWSDYKSCKKTSIAGPTDQPTQLIPGSPGGYQLLKVYQYGVRQQLRNILKPVAGTIRIADGGVEKTEGSQWMVDTTTGLVQLFFSPSAGITWGGEFDVPMRFDSEFQLGLINHEIQSVSFALVELRDPE